MQVSVMAMMKPTAKWLVCFNFLLQLAEYIAQVTMLLLFSIVANQ